MKSLNPNWLTEGWMDFEYKQYILLDYLQKAKRSFKRKSLYPVLSDLVFHYNNIITLKEQKTIIAKQVPRKLEKLDLKNLKVIYKNISLDDEPMQELEKLLDFAIPAFREHLNMWKDLYENVENQMEVDIIGLRPLYDKEGYLFLTSEELSEVMIYRYKLSTIKDHNGNYFALHTQLVRTEEKSIGNHYNRIKLNLLKDNSDLPNPAAFLIMAKRHFPYKNTLLPVAERLLMRTLNLAA